MNIDPSAGAPARICEVKRVLSVIDLAGFTRAANRAPALAIAEFLDRYYGACAEAVVSAGGRVVKYMGDACFAVFPEERCADAVAAVVSLSKNTRAFDNSWGLRFGANVHLGTVAEGELGPPGDRRYDVLGAEVNHLFRMGGGSGIRLSEPVYRQLPNERRGAWHKDKPPATYRMEEGS